MITTIKITPKILSVMDIESIKEAFPNDQIYMGLLWEMIEETDDENIYAQIMDAYFSSDMYYIDLWEKLLPYLHNRLANGKSVNYKKVIYGLNNYGPGKIGDTVQDHIYWWFPKIYSKNYDDYDYPKEVIDFIEEEYGLPTDWKEALFPEDEK